VIGRKPVLSSASAAAGTGTGRSSPQEPSRSRADRLPDSRNRSYLSGGNPLRCSLGPRR